MIRFALIVLAALILGGIIHIMTVLSVPEFASQDLWHRASTLQSEPFEMMVLDDPSSSIKQFPGLDPSFVYGLCLADVKNGPVQMKGDMGDAFWSLSYIDVHSRVQFSLSRGTSSRELNVVLSSKAQQRLLAEQPGLVDETSIFITAKDSKGLLVVRQFVGRESDRADRARKLGQLRCKPVSIPIN